MSSTGVPASRFTHARALLVFVSAVVFLLPPLASIAQNTAPIDESLSNTTASTYIELDSWIYPAIERLEAQGIIRFEFAGLRPWTRRAVYQMLARAEPAGESSARQIDALKQEVLRQPAMGSGRVSKDLFVDELYHRAQVIAGPPLNDSYHFGQTIADDFGRPYGQGWQQITGFETRAEHGPFAFLLRGEYQRTPFLQGYSTAVAGIIAVQDNTPVQIFPDQPVRNSFRLLDAYAALQWAGQQFSFGKQSFWWGPGSASAMMLSNNAEPFYAFRINRTLPLTLPLVSRLLGPLRYDNFFGSLSGHRYPRQPYFYGQKISFAPTRNLELGFSRDAVIAGDGSTPLTFGNFWKSFTSTSSGTYHSNGSNVLGARHGSFDFRYRLPGVRNRLTLYADSLVHDDVSPIAAPRRAATTAGIYVSSMPFASRVDLHVQGGSSDIPRSAEGGKFYYYETVYRDCSTNKGNLIGSSLGREGTGGQAWSTYWFNAQSTLEVGYRTLKVSPFFVPGGESQQSAFGELRYQWRNGLALQLLLQAERWAAPALAPNAQKNFTSQFQVSYSPRSWKSPLSSSAIMPGGHSHTP